LPSETFRPLPVNISTMAMKTSLNVLAVLVICFPGSGASTATECTEGYGLVDARGSLVLLRTEAVACTVCPMGTASQERHDGQGKTFVCEQCQPGSIQMTTFSTTCMKCPKGTATSQIGGTECFPCQVGFYQPNEGSPFCLKCPASRTTKTSRSASLMDCVCPQGSLRTSTDCVEASTTEDFISELETSNAYGMLYFAWILLPTTWFAAF